MQKERYTLYIDESGTHSFTDTREPLNKYFLITALVVSHSEDSKLSGYFEYLKRNHDIDSGTPFHSYDLFENKLSKQYLTPKKATRLCHSLAEFINASPLKFVAFYINKEECRKHFKIKKGLKNDDYIKHEHGPLARDICYEILATQSFWWFAQEIGEGERGSIIAESRSHSDHSLLDTFLISKDPSVFNPLPVGHKKYRACDGVLQQLSQRMHDHITSLKFENKIGECPGLEISDLISFVTFQKLEGRLDGFKDKGFVELWTAIRKNMVNGKPTLITKNQISESLSRNRVHKISKFTTSFR